ncbi:hypothetical protein COUCH_23035 [Couchioplanes caeruleus]|uniref:hypothetical protein n=1 Tax=Couchioplanes caeruleus TaxID=56438 RepID=UPI0020C042B5|nr:hypothetical protein [Couchioplanes caeruleus]UQU61914.1 hypothetical protein COUCH_23035 [Couchioplanes caeruleus]
MTENSENSENTGFLRTLLWVVLVLSAAANAILSSTSTNVFIGAAFGVITLACAAGLVVQHYRHRER